MSDTPATAVEWDDRFSRVAIVGPNGQTIMLSVFDLPDLIAQLTGVAIAAEVMS